MGWQVAMGNRNVRGIASYEPRSGLVFKEDELPPDMPSATGMLAGVPVPLERFKALTRSPSSSTTGTTSRASRAPNPGLDNWRVRLAMARLWVARVNRHGGDAALVHLPEAGLRGNTHFPFSDLNNEQVAARMAAFLADMHLD